MARTVANGCTEDEELVAARMVGKAIAQVDAMGGGAPPEPEKAEPSWAQTERDSREYQTLLEKNTAETLLKAAVQELALNHINTVAPPRKRDPGEPTQRVDIHELLEPHLGMMLAVGGTRMGRQILRRMVDELVYDGDLPRFLDMKLGA
ncbi:MAG: hypothetical protein H7Y60_06780 [Rhodospirillaceae bacterium]|nr:hypothetical protein [Rhodospirillales bacterium]